MYRIRLKPPRTPPGAPLDFSGSRKYSEPPQQAFYADYSRPISQIPLPWIPQRTRSTSHNASIDNPDSGLSTFVPCSKSPAVIVQHGIEIYWPQFSVWNRYQHKINMKAFCSILGLHQSLQHEMCIHWGQSTHRLCVSVLTIINHNWFRQWLGDGQATSHRLNQY